ncbi:cobalamin B12-binding domain-containing protein [Azotosporobacter soli]|uniref:cobalamin B12-binding domain-containing protein n=1 Tax=Azotosporobacter soli TaxID=3055040 RepID=UPI0031FEF140
MIETVIEAYNEAILDTDQERAFAVIHRAVEKGISPEDIIFKIVIPSIELMTKYISETKEASVAQHFLTAKIAAAVTDEMLDKFKQRPKVVGCVVLGTSQGDFHGLGKKIVGGCLKALMIQVIDLGVNVAPEKFVEAAIENKAEVIGIASMMVHTARSENGCSKVRQLVNECGLKGRVRIVVGGAPYRYDHDLYKKVKADAWAENGITAGKIITRLIREVQQ